MKNIRRTAADAACLFLSLAFYVSLALASLSQVGTAVAGEPRQGLNLTFYKEAWCDTSSSHLTLESLEEGSVIDIVSRGQPHGPTFAFLSFLILKG